MRVEEIKKVASIGGGVIGGKACGLLAARKCHRLKLDTAICNERLYGLPI